MTYSEMDLAKATNDSITKTHEEVQHCDASDKFQKEFFTTTGKNSGAVTNENPPLFSEDNPTTLDFSKGDLFAQPKCGQTVDGGQQVKCPPPEWTRDMLRRTPSSDLILDPFQRELTDMAHKLFAKDIENNLKSGDLEGLQRSLKLFEGNPETQAKVIKLLQERLELSGIRVQVENKADDVGGNVVTLKLSRNNNDSKSSGATDFEINSDGVARGSKSRHFLSEPERMNPKGALNHILRGRINLN